MVPADRPILIDTGPIVALLNRRDTYHEWAKAQFARSTPPLLTCEPVLSEACFLLRRISGAPEAVLGLVQRGVLQAPFRLQDESQALAKLMRRYASVPMALADACLLRMAEQQPNCAVMTLDSDFRIYRIHRRRAVPIIMPDRR